MKFTLFAAAMLSGLVPFSATAYQKAEPRFIILPNHYGLAPRHPSSMLPQWSGSFTDLTRKRVKYTMVGADPQTSNTTTTIPVVLIPVKMVYGVSNGDMTFNPQTHKVSNGKTVVQNTMVSPLFKPSIDFVQGGVDLGKTQYSDAFQRGNFWSEVQINPGYHVLLGKPTVLTEQTINVASTQGDVITNPFASGDVGTMDVSAFDTALQGFIKTLSAQINPGVLPIFLTYNVFLTDNKRCCIGGYHSANGAAPGGQTYAYATYVDSVGSFAQDVSGFSHEISEWMDDPFGSNLVNCTDSNVMEVGDPLENEANFGDYPYTLSGFTYNLQSLVFIDYFGAPRTYRVNSWLSFQDDEAGVCPGQ